MKLHTLAGSIELGSPGLFDSAATWRKSMRKIVESYGLDALDRGARPRSRAADDPAEFVAAVSEASVDRAKGVGLGDDLRLRSQRINGAALALDEEVVHLLAFPTGA